VVAAPVRQRYPAGEAARANERRERGRHCHGRGIDHERPGTTVAHASHRLLRADARDEVPLIACGTIGGRQGRIPSLRNAATVPHELFCAYTLALNGALAPDGVADYLSGLLLGAEVAAARGGYNNLRWGARP
jgi:2-keto-3-deoxy-galactonokinase